MPTEPDSVTWRRSSRSGASGGNCIEVAAFDTDAECGLRDSKDPDGAELRVPATAFAALVRAIKAGGLRP